MVLVHGSPFAVIDCVDGLEVGVTVTGSSVGTSVGVKVGENVGGSVGISATGFVLGLRDGALEG